MGVDSSKDYSGNGESNVADQLPPWKKAWDIIVVCDVDAVRCDLFVSQLVERRKAGRLSADCHILSCTHSKSAIAGIGVAGEFLRGLVDGDADVDADGSVANEDGNDFLYDLGKLRALVLETDECCPHFVSPWTSSSPALLPGDRLVALADLMLDSLSVDRVGLPSPGVWITNTSDILLLEDTGGTGSARKALRLDSRICAKSDAQVFLSRLGSRRDPWSFYRAIYDPISSEVEGFVVPKHVRLSYSGHGSDDSDSENDLEGEDSEGTAMEAGAELVCGLIHLSLGLCEEIIDLLESNAFANNSITHTHHPVSLFDDVLEALSTNCTRDSFEASPRSLMTPEMKNQLFTSLHEKFTLMVFESKSTLHRVDTAKHYLDLQTSVLPMTDLAALGYFMPDDGQLGDTDDTGLQSKPRLAHKTSFIHSGRDVAAFRPTSISVASADEPIPGDGSGSPGGLPNYRAASLSVSSEASVHSRIRTRSRSVMNEGRIDVKPDAQTINSLLLGSGSVGRGALIENCRLTGNWKVCEGAMCIGFRSRTRNLRVPPRILMQEVGLAGGTVASSSRSAVIVYHINDSAGIDKSPEEGGTYINQPWQVLLEQSGIEAEELWDEDSERKTLRNAKLFPLRAQDSATLELARYYVGAILAQRHLQGSREHWTHIPPFIVYVARRAWRSSERLALSHIEAAVDWPGELMWKRQLAFRVDEFRLADWLLDEGEQNIVLLRGRPLIERMARDNYTKVFATIDSIIAARQKSSLLVQKALTCMGDAMLLFAKEVDPEGASGDGKSDQASSGAKAVEGAFDARMPPKSALTPLFRHPASIASTCARIAKTRDQLLREADTFKKKAVLYQLLAEYYLCAAEQIA